MRMSSRAVTIAKRVLTNVQRAKDKQVLREKFGKRGRLLQIVKNRSKLNQQLDDVLNDHVQNAKVNGPAAVNPLEETREKLEKLKLNQDHVRTAKMRAHHLTNFLSSYLINAFQSGQVGTEINDRYPLFQISRLTLAADMNKLQIFWLSTNEETVNEDIEKNYLPKFASQIRNVLITNHVIGYIPPVVFVRDNSKALLDHLDELLANSDKQRNSNNATATAEDVQQKVQAASLVNNVYGVDHTQLMNKIKGTPSSSVVINAPSPPQEAAADENAAREKISRTLRAMKINQRMKQEKQSKTALLQIALHEFEFSKQNETSRKKNVYEEDDV